MRPEESPKVPAETACRVCGLDVGDALWDEYGVPQYLMRLLRNGVRDW
ncbi:hypothetical protein GCM10023084_22230 [Streptomyces lacrimifluminis]|uniref:Uncharacterized protein n=1 Tax=Streptomyces lacrimifluminis TaxID=1500077 RepID=A0A917KYV6_9ACTN|nr:hypothetical protein [Streptomyces lacrimifluminis]GGJ36455.1 hypothetical protein GCM10012282_36440 [Streptomyces lacrimifluminis]